MQQGKYILQFENPHGLDAALQAHEDGILNPWVLGGSHDLWNLGDISL